jgi:predicted kinase
LIFEPNDPVLYAAKDTFITLNVIPVYSMNVDAVKELEAIVKKQEKEIISLQKLKPKIVMLDRLKKISE